MPDDWYTEWQGTFNVQSFDPLSESVYAGDRLSIHPVAMADVFGGDWPVGTQIRTVVVDGVGAIVYSPPTEILDDDTVGGYQVVDITRPANGPGGYSQPYYLFLMVAGAVDTPEYNSRMAVLEDVLTSIDFLSDHLSGITWVDTYLDTTPIPGIDRYEAVHPSGWSVVGGPTSFSIASPAMDPTFAAGPVTVGVEPGAVTEWESGEILLGDRRLRQQPGSVQIVNGVRTTVYWLRDGPNDVARITVAQPNLDLTRFRGHPTLWGEGVHDATETPPTVSG